MCDVKSVWWCVIKKYNAEQRKMQEDYKWIIRGLHGWCVFVRMPYMGDDRVACRMVLNWFRIKIVASHHIDFELKLTCLKA